MKTLLITLIGLLLAMPLHATLQTEDNLILNDGTEVSVENFDIGKEGWEKLRGWKAKMGYSGIISTRNAKGYYACLQIKGDRLFLTKLQVDAHSDKKGFFVAEVPLSEIYGQNGAVAADWFSGMLMQRLRGPGPENKFDYRVFFIQKGRLVETKKMNRNELK